MRDGPRRSCPSGDGSAASSPPWALDTSLAIPPTSALAAFVEDEAMGCGSSAPSDGASSARRMERASFLLFLCCCTIVLRRGRLIAFIRLWGIRPLICARGAERRHYIQAEAVAPFGMHPAEAHVAAIARAADAANAELAKFRQLIARHPPPWPPPQPANRYRGLGWALRACDGARADELSKDYRALRT